ncbi:bystin [Drosophila grimshawi]|uniref:GH24352 n=1 Tax=Drosophila grimshawi TaxID=7222 RepID=B4JMC6_DROGR|nr:bystin [Drosophila grimshawi]EDV91887.1 GH24352 [Drosophila grimshawi]
MGKPKKSNVAIIKNVSLENQIIEGKVTKPKKNKDKDKVKLRAEESPNIDAKSSQKILAAARQQQLELDEENFPSLTPRKNVNFNLKDASEQEEGEVNETDFMTDLDMDDDDVAAFERFQQPATTKEGKRSQHLAEMIMQKIQEKGADIHTKISDEGSLKIEEIDPKVKEMYEGVRDVLKRYRSGKIPKAFKIIPKLRNWEQILFITEPHNWSAAAMFQGTRIFCSVLSQAMAQRFYNLVLLPRIRDDLCEYKKLNMHLYNALKRALFKPAAFMKGIVLPLLESGDCTLREAIIFGSVVARSSIPVLHSSACLLKICEMNYSGANSIFIRYFLDKRYALPYRVIDAAVFHFLRFENERRDLPVLWHQSLLTFAQRYKNDISSEQKDALLQLLKKKTHPKITADIRRELQAANCRDVEMMESTNATAEQPIKMYTDADVGYEG